MTNGYYPNGLPFKQSLKKREPTRMIAPFCMKCNRAVDSWLFHRSGHTDGTPLLILRCHGTSVTFGCTPEQADAWREAFLTRFLSNKERITWNADGSLEPADCIPAPEPKTHQSDGGSG